MFETSPENAAGKSSSLNVRCQHAADFFKDNREKKDFFHFKLGSCFFPLWCMKETGQVWAHCDGPCIKMYIMWEREAIASPFMTTDRNPSGQNCWNSHLNEMNWTSESIMPGLPNCGLLSNDLQRAGWLHGVGYSICFPLQNCLKRFLLPLSDRCYSSQTLTVMWLGMGGG